MASCRSAALVPIEQPHQRGGDGTEIGATFGGADQQDLTGRHRLREAVGGAVLASGALVFDQLLDMGGNLDLRALVVAARVAGEHRGTVDNAHLMWIGEDGQWTPDMVMGDRLCRSPDYADHRPEPGSKGGDRCRGRGIIRTLRNIAMQTPRRTT